jgi:hypothetical protein
MTATATPDFPVPMAGENTQGQQHGPMGWPPVPPSPTSEQHRAGRAPRYDLASTHHATVCPGGAA